MCVPNLAAQRRPQPTTTQVNGLSPSEISQHLLKGFEASNYTNFAAVPVEPPKPVGSTRPKRRRKPQKPGKTAKNHDRHFVMHNYHDHANDLDDGSEEEAVPAEEHDDHKRRGGVSMSFPLKLHGILDQVEADGLGNIVSWMPHGRCFVIHKPKEFVDLVMPKYFRQTKLTSFQRQLNLYGFFRLTRGADAGGYYHELFLRGKPGLCKSMARTKVKGTMFKAASSPDQEPDFYTMAPVAPIVSSDEEVSTTSDRSSEASSYPQPYSMLGSLPVPTPYMSQQVYNIQSTYPTYQSSVTAPLLAVSEYDRIFDEAVDELFLNDNAEQDAIDEFVRDWEPESFPDTLQSDVQLGYMLERLLED